MKDNNKNNNAAILKINELLNLNIEFDKNPAIDAEKLLFKVEENKKDIEKQLENAFKPKIKIEMLDKIVQKIEDRNSQFQLQLESIDDQVQLKLIDTKKETVEIELHADLHWQPFMHDVKVYHDDDVYDAKMYVAKIDIDKVELIKGNEDIAEESGMFLALENVLYSRHDEEDQFLSVSDCLCNGKPIMDLDDFCIETFKALNEDCLDMNVLRKITPKKEKAAALEHA